jgi:hypothetical protein
MATCWKWAFISPNAGQMVTDKVFIATALLANMFNVYEGKYDQYFQEHINMLELTPEQKDEVIEFIYLTTNTIYSKQDFPQMLPKYLTALNMVAAPESLLYFRNIAQTAKKVL